MNLVRDRIASNLDQPTAPADEADSLGGPGPSAVALPCQGDDSAAVGASHGVNIQPGSDDDGWIVPHPVTLSDGTRVQLYKDGEALHAGLEAIRAARRRICLEVYIFGDDETGHAYAEALSRKSRDGVRVYVIYDSVGSRGFTGPEPEMIREMRRNGVNVQQFHPMRPWECQFSWRPANRDHRKLLLIDDDIAGMGGLNVGAEYAGSWVSRSTRSPAADVGGGIGGAAVGAAAAAARAAARAARVVGSGRRERRARGGMGSRRMDRTGRPPAPPVCDAWRDTAIGIRGPGAVPFQRAFASTWRYTTHGGRIRTAEYRHNLDEGEVGVLASVPTMNSPLRPTLHALMSSARESLDMTMAYFVPDDALIDELCQASRRGARVRLMLPGVSDVPVVRLAGRAFYGRLLDCGVQVYERQGVILHAKTMVIDGRTSVIGSTNLDYRSIEYNLELSAIIRDETFGRQMRDLFEHDVRHALPITPDEWRRLSHWDRFVQWAVSRARYLL